MGVNEAKRALDRLWILFKRRGKGTIRWVEEELGLAPNALHSWRQRNQLRYADLIAILFLLDEDPGGFFGGLFQAEAGAAAESEPLPKNDDGMGLLLRRAERMMYEDPAEALSLLAGFGAHFGGSWKYCLAVGITLRLLELWSKAQKWIERAHTLAPDDVARARCLVRICPILICPRSSPEKAIAVLDRCMAHLSGSELALAVQHKALALRALGDLSECTKACVVALSKDSASLQTITSSWQTLGLALSEAGDSTGGRKCLEKALPFAQDRWSKGHVLWARARMAQDSEASGWYNSAFRSFGSGLVFESFQLVVERFTRIGFAPHLYRALVERCRLQNDLFLEVAEDLQASSRLRGRNFDDLISELRESWDRCRLSQLRHLGL